MKFFLLFLAVFGVASANYYGYRRFGSEQSELARAGTTILQAVEKVCPGYSDPFMNATKQVIGCVEKMDKTSLTMCSMYQIAFDSCFKPYVDMFTTCLSNNKDFPLFIIKTLKDLYSYVCHQDGEHLMESLNPCIRTALTTGDRCDRILKSKIQSITNGPFSVGKMCDLMREMRVCILSRIERGCHNEVTREHVSKVYDVLMKHCPLGNELTEEFEELN